MMARQVLEVSVIQACMSCCCRTITVGHVWPTLRQRLKSCAGVTQACMALRNMVARNPELRPAVLERGVEAFLRRAKVAHPATCADVGSAALRDLGFDDYLT